MSIKIAILASGSGTNAERIISLCKSRRLDAHVALVLSNRPGAGVLARANAANTPCRVIDHKLFHEREKYDSVLVENIQEAGCELVVLAGYMRLLTGSFLRAFPGKVINIHPALLPSFPGVHGAADATRYGVKISGASVHFVEEKMDSGPLIIQGAVPVNAGETPDELQRRIHAVEYRIYPQAIQWIAQNRIHIEGRQVFLSKNPQAKALPQLDSCFIWPPMEEEY